jgi:hypothetical protein
MKYWARIRAEGLGGFRARDTTLFVVAILVFGLYALFGYGAWENISNAVEDKNTPVATLALTLYLYILVAHWLAFLLSVREEPAT